MTPNIFSELDPLNAEMTNKSCASAEDISHLQGFNQRFAAFCALSCIAATFFVSLLALRMIQQSIFQFSTKILLVFNIFYANLHQVMYAVESVAMIYKGLFLEDEPCKWMQSDKHCFPYTYLLYIGISGMVYAQTGLIIERAFATFYKNYNSSVSRITGISVFFLVFLCSSITYRIILWNDPLDGYSLSCFVAPLPSAARANYFMCLCVALVLFNLGTSMAVMYYNKRMEYEIRYKVKERFKNREAIDSTHTICVVSMSQFATMFTYSLGVFLLRCYKIELGISLFKTLIVWVYTLPYSALLLPLILIFRIRATKFRRTQKINDITSTRQTQDEHISQINQMWS